MSWDRVKLSEIADIKAGGTPSRSNLSYWTNGKIPWVKIGDIKGKYVTETEEKITEEGLNNSSAKLLSKGTILYSIFASLGETAILDIDATTNQAIAGIIPKCSNIEPMYLYYYLIKMQPEVIEMGRGVAQNNINLGIVRNFEIPLPTIEVQRKIAESLDKSYALIEKRKEQVAVLDKLAKDTFIDMFGDPLTNPMGWDVVPLLDVASIDTRMTKDFETYAECFHIGIENIEKETGAITNPKKVKDSGLISGKYEFDERHIIYSKIRPNLNKVALPTFKGLCSADSYPILPKAGMCNRDYLAVIMRSQLFLKYILDFSGRTNIPKVNKKQVAGFKFPLPPFEIQEDYAKRMAVIELQKSRLKDSLTLLETTFRSTMQKAFNGELF